MYEKTISFIKDFYGNHDFTPLAVPVFIGNEKKYLNECIDSTFVSSVGKFVDSLENTFWFADRVVNIPSSVRM